MKTYVNDLDLCVGKRISGIGYDASGEIMLVFDDDTFLTMQTEENYEDIATINVPMKFDVFRFSNAECLRLGVYTQDELDAMRKARD